MAKQKKKVSSSTKAEQSADQLLSKTDQFLDKHLKEVIIVASVIVILVLAILGARHFYLIPKEQKAENALYKAEHYLGNQEWNSALMGDSLGSYGFLDIADEFGSTKSGNLAKAYAGICYYHLGDYGNALDYLKKYKQKDHLIGATVTGMIGDCYANTEKPEEAINYFTKAASIANSEVLSPIYLKKAATAYELLGQHQKAIDVLKQIQNKYPSSVEARTVEKEILRNEGLLKQ